MRAFMNGAWLALLGPFIVIPMVARRLAGSGGQRKAVKTEGAR